MKNHMLTYRRSDKFEVIGYTDFDFAGCVDSLNSTSGYILCWLEECKANHDCLLHHDSRIHCVFRDIEP
jgi:hypothetical protein